MKALSNAVTAAKAYPRFGHPAQEILITHNTSIRHY
jgi:hypothetical protein